MRCPVTAKNWPQQMRGHLMPPKLPPNVERNQIKGHTYLSFRIGKGPRIRLPNDPTSQEFRDATAPPWPARPGPSQDAPGTIGALITSYKQTGQFAGLSETSKTGYMSRLEAIRVEHGHRAVAGLTKERLGPNDCENLQD
jgi:enterobacteria phage integrase